MNGQMNDEVIESWHGAKRSDGRVCEKESTKQDSVIRPDKNSVAKLSMRWGSGFS